MKIAFVGDSFCADTGPETWPSIVKEKLNATQIWKGVQGANQYTILKHTKKRIFMFHPVIKKRMILLINGLAG